VSGRPAAGVSKASASLLIGTDRLVTGAGHDAPGWLRINDGVICESGSGAAPGPVDDSFETIVPGFVDTHVHGAGGVDFATLGADPTIAIDFHARAGSTSLVASVATGDWAGTLDRLRELAPLVTAGQIAGLHLEGPYLSYARRGAHDPALLREPNAAEIAAALDAAGGALVMVTIAPELPGALNAITQFVGAGVTVAIGHTDASAEVMRRSVDAGASVVTHLFNGMPPLHHRMPGPVGVALTDDSLVLELIGDGHHLSDLAVDLVRQAASGRYVLVSDAMAATGLGDGRYDLAGSDVVVVDGVAMLADASSLAGSTTPVAGALARLLERGVPLSELVGATSTQPAHSLGLPNPSLVAGGKADLVALTGSRVARVMKAGSWLA
jgi:N-acetylglucosamine-6-phosphate deacetylase